MIFTCVITVYLRRIILNNDNTTQNSLQFDLIFNVEEEEEV
jgi:hypothetical protein